MLSEIIIILFTRILHKATSRQKALFIHWSCWPPPLQGGGRFFWKIFWTTYPITIILLVLERGSMNGCSEYLQSYHWAYEKFSTTIWKKSCDQFVCKIWLVLVSKYSIFFTAFFQKSFFFLQKLLQLWFFLIQNHFLQLKHTRGIWFDVSRVFYGPVDGFKNDIYGQTYVNPHSSHK